MSKYSSGFVSNTFCSCGHCLHLSEHPSQIIRDPKTPPQLNCGCGRVAVERVARTSRNRGRHFCSCNVCHLWIWLDLLNNFAEEMVFFTNSSEIVVLQGELVTCRKQIREADSKIKLIESELSNLSQSIHPNVRKELIPEVLHEFVEKEKPKHDVLGHTPIDRTKLGPRLLCGCGRLWPNSGG